MTRRPDPGRFARRIPILPARRAPNRPAPTRPAPAGRPGYAVAALAVLTCLGLGIGVLAVGPRDGDQDDRQPSVAIEETHPGLGSDTPRSPGAPGYDPRQANLVTAEDQRVFDIVGQVLPGTPPRELTSPGAPPTLVLPSRTAPYTLATLVSAGAVVHQPGALLVVKNVLVAPGAQLDITVPGGRLRLSSGPTGFTSLIGFKATLDLAGDGHAPLTVTSWNPATNSPDTDETDGRAYLRSIGGRMDLDHVALADLGFWSGRTGGLAWTGSASAPASGTATEITATGNHYGMFLSRSNGVLVNGALISRSAMDGVSVHTSAQGTQLWRVDSTDSGRNGIDVSAGATDTTMRQVSTTGSARNGIYLDGTPPAFGPNAGGGTTEASTGFAVDGSTSRGNSEHGILVIGADDVRLTNNTVAANRDGVIIRGVTKGVVLRANHISSPGGFAVAVRGGARDAVVDQNSISDALTAVQVNDSVAEVTHNEIAGVVLHGVSLIGHSGGSSVKDNRVDGRGPSAVDTNRLVTGAVITKSGNDESNWTTDRDNVQFVSGFVRNHPLVLLWFLTLMFPLAARVIYRRRDQRVLGRHPYAGRPGQADIPPAAVRPAAVRPAAVPLAAVPPGTLRPDTLRPAAAPPAAVPPAGTPRAGTPPVDAPHPAVAPEDAEPIRLVPAAGAGTSGGGWPGPVRAAESATTPSPGSRPTPRQRPAHAASSSTPPPARASGRAPAHARWYCPVCADESCNASSRCPTPGRRDPGPGTRVTVVSPR